MRTVALGFISLEFSLISHGGRSEMSEGLGLPGCSGKFGDVDFRLDRWDDPGIHGISDGDDSCSSLNFTDLVLARESFGGSDRAS